MNHPLATAMFEPGSQRRLMQRRSLLRERCENRARSIHSTQVTFRREHRAMIVARFSAQCALVVIAAIALALPFSAARPVGAELMQQSWLPVPAGRFNHARVPVVLGKDRPSLFTRQLFGTPLSSAGQEAAPPFWVWGRRGAGRGA
jgi:hypothetical protein